MSELVTGRFRDESFQAVNWIGAVNQTHNKQKIHRKIAQKYPRNVHNAQI